MEGNDVPFVVLGGLDATNVIGELIFHEKSPMATAVPSVTVRIGSKVSALPLPAPIVPVIRPLLLRAPGHSVSPSRKTSASRRTSKSSRLDVEGHHVAFVVLQCVQCHQGDRRIDIPREGWLRWPCARAVGDRDDRRIVAARISAARRDRPRDQTTAAEAQAIRQSGGREGVNVPAARWSSRTP